MYLGYLLPTIIQLQTKYKDLLKTRMDYCKPLIVSILEGLDKRFRSQLKDPFFIISSLSHPFFKTVWIDNQETKSEALHLFKEAAIHLNSLPILSSSQTPLSTQNVEDGESFFHWTSSQNPPEITCVENEINMYLSKSPQKDLSCFKNDNLPILKKVFIKFNTPLPSSAPIERVFSVGGAVLTKKRGRITDNNFEKVMLLKCNKIFVAD